MSAKWVGYFLDDAVGITEPMELLLAVAIADHADANGEAYPGLELLARKIRRDKRTVRRILQRLERTGYVEVTRFKGRGKMTKMQLKKGTRTTSFIDDEKGTSVTAFILDENEKKGTNRDIKGDIAMSFPPTPPYKDEPFKPLRVCVPAVSEKNHDDEGKNDENTHTASPTPSPPYSIPDSDGQAAAVEEYHKVFPEQRISIYQRDLIAGTVTDIEVWRSTLKFWAGNNHIARNVANIVNKYSELEQEKRNGKNGNDHRQNGNSRQSFREQREQRALAERDFWKGIERIRDGGTAEPAGQKLLGGGGSDRSG